MRGPERAQKCVYVCQRVIMENKEPLVQSETEGFEVRWKMLFCLAEQTQWCYSGSPPYCLLSPLHTHTHIHTRMHTHWKAASGDGVYVWRDEVKDEVKQSC